jgi:hypothetical protein
LREENRKLNRQEAYWRKFIDAKITFTKAKREAYHNSKPTFQNLPDDVQAAWFAYRWVDHKERWGTYESLKLSKKQATVYMNRTQGLKPDNRPYFGRAAQKRNEAERKVWEAERSVIKEVQFGRNFSVSTVMI